MKSTRKHLCDVCRQRNLDERITRVKAEAKVRKKKLRRLGLAASDKHRARARRGGGDFDPKVTRLAVLERDDWLCGICHKPIPNLIYVSTASDEYGTVDHIVPLAHGGSHTWDNVRAAHNRCNWQAYLSQYTKGA